jgi:hypothetical protein
MFDGSTLPLEENLRIAADLLQQCAQAGVVLEIECGVVGGRGGRGRATGPREKLYTTTADLIRVAEVTHSRAPWVRRWSSESECPTSQKIPVRRPVPTRRLRTQLAGKLPGARVAGASSPFSTMSTAMMAGSGRKRAKHSRNVARRSVLAYSTRYSASGSS